MMDGEMKEGREKVRLGDSGNRLQIATRDRFHVLCPARRLPHAHILVVGKSHQVQQLRSGPVFDTEYIWQCETRSAAVCARYNMTTPRDIWLCLTGRPVNIFVLVP